MSEIQAEQIEPEQQASVDVLDSIDALIANDGNVPNTSEKEASEPELERELDEPEQAVEVEAEPEMEGPEIDYDLEIPMPDGREPMTLGQMKDRVNQLERTDQQMIERENALMRQQDELAEVMQQMGGIPPGLQEQAAQRNQQRLQHEHERMLEAIPEWKEKETFDRDRGQIFETAKQYGLGDEIGQISDHRIVKLLRDFSRLLSKSTEGETLKKEIHKASTVKGRKPRLKTKQSALDKQVSEAMASNNVDTRLDAIDKLLGG